MHTKDIDAIEAAALRLPQADRARLVERLLESLEQQDEILAAWVAEAERRVDALDRGEMTTTDFDQVMNPLRAGLSR